MDMNRTVEEKLSVFFRVLGQTARIQILLVIADGPACVCHLEAYLNLRQALISQHLMVLREAGLVETQREGRNIYYRLIQPELLEVVRSAARLVGQDPVEMERSLSNPINPCPCPHCNPDQPGITCSPQ